MPTVSVIIPTYGHRDFVVATIESVLAQTMTDFEIIVVNDGSPDDTRDVLRPLVESGRIRYVEQPNGGQAAARNRGLTEARGEFVALLDDDDVWPADKLQWQVDALRASPRDQVIGGSCDLLMPSGKVERCDPPADPVTWDDLFARAPFWSPGQTLIRRSAMEAVGGLSTDTWGADDYDLWFRLARLAPIRTSTRLALGYRLHAANASRDHVRMIDNTRLVVRRHLAEAPVAERRALLRANNRWLYGYLGTYLLAESKHCARRLRVRRAARAFSRFAPFLLAAAKDSTLRGRIAQESLPRRLSAAAGPE